MTTVQLSTATENGWSIGHRFGQVEYVENPSAHARNNDRHDPRGTESWANWETLLRKFREHCFLAV